MSKKFNRASQQLKARVLFIRGSVSKKAGEVLSDEETDTMTDDAISDEITFGTFEAIDREPPAGQADLSKVKTHEAADAVAAEEGVDLTDKTTVAEKVDAIEAARVAKAKGE